MVWPRFSDLSTPIDSDLPDVPTFNTTEKPGVLTQLAYIGLYPIQGADTNAWYNLMKGRRSDFEKTLKPHNLDHRLNYAERQVCLERLSQVKEFSRSLLSAAQNGSLTTKLAIEMGDLDNEWVLKKITADRAWVSDLVGADDALPWSLCPSDVVISSGLENYKEVMAYCVKDWMGESSYAGDGSHCRDYAFGLAWDKIEKRGAGVEASPVSLFVLLTVLAGIAGFVYIISRLLKWLEEQTQENRRLSDSNRRLSNALMFPETAGAGEAEVEESVPVLAPRRKSRARRGE